MGRGLYSQTHDPENLKKRKKKVRKAKRKVVKKPSSAINFQAGSAPTSGTPTSRKALRLRQLQQDQNQRVQGQELGYDQVGQEVDTRRVYETQVDDSPHHAPRALGPQYQKRKPHTTALPDPDVSHDADLVKGSRNQIVAAMDVGDQAIIAVDNAITSATAEIQNLLTAAKGLENRANSEHDEDGQLMSSNAERIVMIAGEAILPWLHEIENHMEDILKSSNEGQFILETEQIDDGSLEQEPLSPEDVEEEEGV